MSTDKKVRVAPKRAPKKVELGWFQAKVYSIAVLYMVITVVGVLIYSAVNYYGSEKVEPLIASKAEAAKESKKEEAPKEAESCQDAIAKYSKQYEVDENLLMRIAEAESGFNHEVKNSTSTASGCFQWLTGSWNDYGKKLWGKDFYKKNVYNPDNNTELAAWVIKTEGTGPWNASAHNW